jgi:hypothetical protein
MNRDPWPKQGRLRQRFEQTVLDPIEVELLAAEAREEQRRAEVAEGITPQADPADLRGIPVIARGTSGTSPGTSPHGAIR